LSLVINPVGEDVLMLFLQAGDVIMMVSIGGMELIGRGERANLASRASSSLWESFDGETEGFD
jgi:hypothetical protein